MWGNNSSLLSDKGILMDITKRGKGRPPKEPTTVIRVPTRLLAKIKTLIKREAQKNDV